MLHIYFGIYKGLLIFNAQAELRLVSIYLRLFQNFVNLRSLTRETFPLADKLMDCESDVTLWNSTWHISFTFFYVLIFDSRKSIRYDLSLYQFRWICNLTNTLGSQKGAKVDQNGKGAKPTNFQIKTNGIDFYPIRQFSSESWKYSRGLPTFFLSSMKIRLRCAGNFTNYFLFAYLPWFTI